MGIPSFYRWLVEKYPHTVEQVTEEAPKVVNGVTVPIDSSLPNPNGVEFDNLYLDMNGIIHPCFHPEGGLPGPETYDEVFAAVFNFIDRIFSIVRPRKLLFLAIDGVAPRAKMNQQRSRRFRAAKDAADEALGTDRLDKSDPLEQPNKKMDSNVITPGTEFMALLSSALQYYIHLRMNEDLGWRGIKVILSDANVPGEGEHKIMSYIRLQRNLPGFDPNTRHCLFGLDADLIMLALASHEIHFTILREDVRRSSDKNKKRMRGLKREWGSKQTEVVGKNLESYIQQQKFQFLKVYVLREYLARAMAMPQSGVEVDLERLIDDFVFMCLFVGNDFLPHIPTLEISEGAIDLLMIVYKNEFVQMGGYLTNSFEVNLERAEHFVKVIGSHECALLRRRRKKRETYLCYQRKGFAKYVEPNTLLGSSRSSLECITAPVSQHPQNIQNPINCTSNGTDTIVDKIKLGEEGWKERFYAENFEAKTEDEREQKRKHVVVKYIEGICWVMRYYYEGVCSWQWFYPYHYAPFASDFHGIGQLEIHFTLGEPVKPFDQLMGVLPAASAHALPLFYRKLMTDILSPILDFYPTDFELDMHGKRFPWQAICKLPFIEESRLLSEIANVEHTLTDEERQRNSLGLDVLYVHISHPLAAKIIPFYEQKDDYSKLLHAKVKIDPKFSGGMNGDIYISDKPACPAEVYSPIEGLKMIANNQVISVFYKYPAFHPHIPRPPNGVILPNQVILHKKFVNRFNIKRSSVMPAVSGHVSSERPIPKFVSGEHLAKLARGLVCKHFLTKWKQTLGCTKLGDHEGAVKTKANVGSMKRNIDDRTKEQNQGKGDGVQNSKFEKLESCIIGKQREGGVDQVGANGLGEMKSLVKSKKKRRRSKKKSKQSEDDGVPSNNIGKFEGSILREQKEGDGVLNDKVEILKTMHVGQSESHGDHSAADGSVEMKTEGKSRKRKRRSKKRKHSEGDGIANSEVEKLENCIIGQPSVGVGDHTGAEKLKHGEGNGVANNNVKKLESCIPREPSERRGKHVDADKLYDGVPSNNIGKFEGSILREQREGDGVLNDKVEILKTCIVVGQSESHGDHSAADGSVEMKTEGKSRKRKRRSKKRKHSEGDGIANSEVEKLENCIIGQPSVGVGDHTGAEKLKHGEGNGVANNNVKKLESCIPREPSERGGNHVDADKLYDGVPSNNIGKFEGSILREQKEGDGVLNDKVEILKTCIVVGQSESRGDHLAADGSVEMKTEGKSRKRKRRSKLKHSKGDGIANNEVEKLDSCIIGQLNHTGAEKLKYSEGDGVANNNVKKLESCIPREPSQWIGNHIDADKLYDGVPSNNIGKFEGSIMREQKEGDGVLNDKVEVLKTCIVGGHSESRGDHSAADGSVEIKTEGKSRKRKRRSKKSKHSEADGIANNQVEKLESCIIGQLSVGAGDHTGAEKLTHSEGDGVANNNAKKLESCIPREPSEMFVSI